MESAPNPKRVELRIAVGATVLLVVLLAVLAAALNAASLDPQGVDQSLPLTKEVVPSLAPLYGAVGTPMRSLDWSPDGREIAVVGGPILGVSVLDPATGHVIRNWSVPGILDVVRYSPDGDELAIASLMGIDGPGWVYIYSRTGELLSSWQASSREVGGLAWSPDGTRLVTTANVRYAIWDVQTQARLWYDGNASTWGESVAWSPDGTLLAFGSVGGPAVYDATTHALLFETVNGTWDSRGVEWSHAGGAIATANLAGCTNVYLRTGRRLWNYDVAAIPKANGGCDIEAATTPSWDPTDSMIAVATGQGVRIFDAGDGSLLRTLTFPVDQYGSPWFVGRLPGSTTYDWDAHWSPNGTALAAVGMTSNPSFRMWGLPHRSGVLWVLLFDGVLALGIPLALGAEFLGLLKRPAEAVAFHARRSSAAGVGGILLTFAFLVAVLQQSFFVLMERIYGAQVVPPPGWFAVNGALSLVLAIPAVAAGVVGFRAVVWPIRGDHPGLRAAVRILGILLLPVVWLLALGGFGYSLAVALGAPASGDLAAGFAAVTGGIGLWIAAKGATGVPPATFRRSLAALLAATGLSIGASLVAFWAFAVILKIIRFTPPGDLALYGTQINFGFGLTPWVAAVIVLAMAGAAALFSKASPGLLAPLYTRLKAQEILDLESRRRVVDYLEGHPGAHFRELLRSLPLGSGNLYYHLYVLEREGLIIARREGVYRKFFVRPFVARAGSLAPQT